MTVSYREGSVFAVPLRKGGYALGVVARVTAETFGGCGAQKYHPRKKRRSKLTDKTDPN